LKRSSDRKKKAKEKLRSKKGKNKKKKSCSELHWILSNKQESTKRKLKKLLSFEIRVIQQNFRTSGLHQRSVRKRSRQAAIRLPHRHDSSRSKQASHRSVSQSVARSRGLSFGLSAIAGVRSPPTLLGVLNELGPLFRGLNRSWTPFLGLNKYSKDLSKFFSVKVTGITECFSLRISGKYSTLGSASIDKMKNIPP
jgi:hypothetical protein